MTIKLRYTAQLKDAAEVGEDVVDLNENDGVQVLLKQLFIRLVIQTMILLICQIMVLQI